MSVKGNASYRFTLLSPTRLRQSHFGAEVTERRSAPLKGQGFLHPEGALLREERRSDPKG
ncbi:hypothetical protein STEG23_001878, partial [Scotinomys teguina]